MIVGRGALSVRTFSVSGKNANPDPDQILERLASFKFTGLGSTEEGASYGWVGPEHLFDGDFGQEKVLRGPYAVFSFRVDTRRVNGTVLAAHVALEVQAALEAEGKEKLGAARRREIKDAIKRRLLEETPPAQHAYGVFWNLKARRVFVQSTSKTVLEAFRTFFERAFKLELEPQVPGLAAAAHAKEQGVMPTLRDLTPFKLRPTPREANVAERRPKQRVG